MAQLHAHQHVVLFTHNEQSHINPMLALGQALASRGFHATCALPATSYASYCDNSGNSSQFNDNLFQVVSVAEAAEQSSNDIFMLQKKLEEGLVQLIGRLEPPPSCLIADMMYFHWSQGVADRCCLTRFHFCPFLATSLLIGFHFPELLQMGLLPVKPGDEDKVIDFIPGLMKGFCLADVPLEFLGRSAAELEASNFLKCSEGCAGFVMSHTSYALAGEADAIDALINHHKLRIYPVAPMLHIERLNNGSLPIDKSITKEGEECLKWLDRQPSGSVVYASFGGVISLTQGDIHELALALEACGQPFLWAAQRLEDGSDLISMLPSGFLERTSGRGCILPWAPQMAVLSHSSVGCFLTHCGCTSVLEALWTGVPMIGGFNKICDQNTTMRLMVDRWGVALPVRSKEHVPLRSSIVGAIQEVRHGQIGAAIKQRTLELKAAIRKSTEPDGVSITTLDHFMDALLCSQSKQSHHHEV